LINIPKANLYTLGYTFFQIGIIHISSSPTVTTADSTSFLPIIAAIVVGVVIIIVLLVVYFKVITKRQFDKLPPKDTIRELPSLTL
jgi:hypothetical protein